MWQQLIVGVIVAACALHAATRYLPVAWRRQIVYALSRRGFDQARLAKLFKTEPSCGSGCGSCGAASSSSASACGTSPSSGAASAPTDSSNTARRVILLHVQR
ncbi:hypothetical protein GJ700_27245 [Duganella sp. FT92W]|uniref:Uncharacterized protein n=1 Tax=Pseudoduganella rivuli TaxID=2666085 RepID=A0A7X2LU92_9BURK|nr:DUF6587 family protein [Pseudoduganella rivuli]MRV75420.1 hypothetical protein [Pseudoduganella rivuli]